VDPRAPSAGREGGPEGGREGEIIRAVVFEPVTGLGVSRRSPRACLAGF